MSRGIIYLILNKQTGHKYIGHTELMMNKQWSHHISCANKMSSEPIHRAFREYGVHRFNIQELDAYDSSNLQSKLTHWMNKYHPEYNVLITEEEEEEEEITIPSPPVVSPNRYWGTFTDENRGNGKHCGIPLRAKNLETGIVVEFENARVAAFILTGNPNRNGNILKAAKKGYIAYGHRWQILEEKQKKKSVFGVNKKTEQIELRYESIAEAVRQLGGAAKGTGLIKSLRNPGRYSWRGYYWFYSRL